MSEDIFRSYARSFEQRREAEMSLQDFLSLCRDDPMAYATAHGIPYQLFEPHVPTPKPKAYSDNFRFDRKVPWSH